MERPVGRNGCGNNHNPITDVAGKIGLKWPMARREETISDYLCFGLNEIDVLRGFGKRKIGDLIRCVAAVVMNADVFKISNTQAEEKKGISEKDFFKTLLASKDPRNMIKDELWQKWTDQLDMRNMGVKSIFDIAQTLGLKWAYARREEKISDYAHLDLKEISSLKGLGRQKIRTLILCMAKAALEGDEPNEDQNEAEEIP